MGAQMNNFFSKLKVSKNNLRQINNSLKDDFDSIKYDITLIKRKIRHKNSNNRNIKENKSVEIDKSFHIAFAVTEAGADVSAGDYFTALELGEGLKKFDWEISFLPKNGQGYWYEVDVEVDVIISMLDNFDPRRIRFLKQGFN